MKMTRTFTTLALLAAAPAFADTTAKFTLSDGSVINGKILGEKITVETLVGRIEIPLDTITGVEFVGNVKDGVKNDFTEEATLPKKLPPEAAPPMNREIPPWKTAFKPTADIDPRLLYWNTFDTEEELRGMGEWSHGKIVEGKFGKALHTGGKADVYQITIPPNTLKPKGCIEFWARIEPERDFFGDGSWLRFFWIGHTRLEFAVNNGMAAGGITSYVGNSVVGSSRFGVHSRYSEVLGPDYKGWHHYALVWSDEELDIGGGGEKPYSAIYMDGRRVSSLETNRGNMKGPLDMKPAFSKEQCLVLAGSAYTGVSTIARAVPFAIDDLKIWGYAKTEFETVPQPVTAKPGW